MLSQDKRDTQQQSQEPRVAPTWSDRTGQAPYSGGVQMTQANRQPAPRNFVRGGLGQNR